MRFSVLKNKTKKFHIYFFSAVLLVALSGCMGEDTPFKMTPRGSGGTTGGSSGSSGGGTGSSGGVGGGDETACYINFDGKNGGLQLKVSANPPSGQSPTEILDGGFEPMPTPVPLKVEGSKISLDAKNFPTVYFRLPPGSGADLKITATPGTVAFGEYNPETHEMTINNFSFDVAIVVQGTQQEIYKGVPPDTVSGINLTTGQVTAKGNYNDIVEQGFPIDLNQGNKIALVAGVHLPENFVNQGELTKKIGGGALTARFEGVFDSLPEDCVAGEPGGTGGTGGEEENVGAPEFDIVPDSFQNTNAIEGTEYDLGVAEVLPTIKNGKQILNCGEVGARGTIIETLFLKNTTDQSLTINSLQGFDTDGDVKDVGCTGTTEFIVGSIFPTGAVTCEKVGNSYVLPCTVPKGEDNYFTFSAIYRPFNYDPENADQDTGTFKITYNTDKIYEMKVKALSVPITTGFFNLVKEKQGVESSPIPDQGLIKVSAPDQNTYTQNLILKNSGPDSWNTVSISIEGEDAMVYKVKAGYPTVLKASENGSSATLPFSIELKAAKADEPYKATLKVSMVNDLNPNFIKDLSFEISGTVGIPSLAAKPNLKVKFQIDWMTAFIRHPVLYADPVESVDYRALPNNSPEKVAPFELVFNPLQGKADQSDILLNAFSKDIYQTTLGERQKMMRILNSRATMADINDGKGGPPDGKVDIDEYLSPFDNADKCTDLTDISQIKGAFNKDLEGCAYYYFYFSQDPANKGYFNNDTGEMILPQLKVRLMQPYHASLPGWPANTALDSKSGGNAPPYDYKIDTTIDISLGTYLIDSKIRIDGSQEPKDNLVPSPRVFEQDLKLSFDELGQKECKPDHFNDNNLTPDQLVSDVEKSKIRPRIECFVSNNTEYANGEYGDAGGFIVGKNVSLRGKQNDPNNYVYDVVLVGVSRFGPYIGIEGSQEMPFFLADNDGQRVFIAIQARMFVPKN